MIIIIIDRKTKSTIQLNVNQRLLLAAQNAPSHLLRSSIGWPSGMRESSYTGCMVHMIYTRYVRPCHNVCSLDVVINKLYHAPTYIFTYNHTRSLVCMLRSCSPLSYVHSPRARYVRSDARPVRPHAPVRRACNQNAGDVAEGFDCSACNKKATSDVAKG